MTFGNMGERKPTSRNLIPDEIVTRFAFSGEAPAIARQVEALQPCGVDEVILAIPVAPDITPRDVIMRELGPLIVSTSGERL